MFQGTSVTLAYMDGMVNSQGRGQNFFDGGSAARTNQLGAMQTSNKMDGPGAANHEFEGTDNTGVAKTPSGIAGNGTN